jgi:hypothetical protein
VADEPTAYPATARALAEAFGAAPLDRASFARPLARCALAGCQGTCCTEGVTLNAEEAMVIGALVRRERGALEGLLPGFPAAPLVVEGGSPPGAGAQGVGADEVGERDGWDDDDAEEDDEARVTRTVLVPRRYHGVVADYPAHFGDAACAFLTPEARCALQVLAERRGRPAWYWKPLACWLHPIALAPEGIALPDAASDRHAARDGASGPPGGFASATFCGRTAPGGRPAHEVLGAELALLGRLLGRDLGAEAAAPG